MVDRTRTMTQEAITGSIGYLIARICKMHRNRAGELLSTVNLYVGQEMFLLQLWERDGQTQTELAEGLCVQPATVTRMLDRMEKAGLVARHKDPSDQRVSRVFLTDSGRSLRGPVEDAWQQLEQTSLAHFTVEERILLRRLLLQLFENLSGRKAVFDGQPAG
jgi:DNA-binding MarR family transcriptional regulator